MLIRGVMMWKLIKSMTSCVVVVNTDENRREDFRCIKKAIEKGYDARNISFKVTGS